ncbi:isochorismatase family protein [Lentzea sp. PSKA42]|uniref:Isochorismatase family protein n=1 Tax=Lentzea indica TaxID=2604800 RepID=A0ABX1FLY7_9PSEU|nr:isochorismatase family protein [Lentzea indica]NKE59980.1 isochorismatase family protein [Lentzea indica]
MPDTARFLDMLTRENAVLLLVDHQIGLFTGVRDIETAQLKHNVVGLAKAAEVLGVPIVATTTSADSMWGPLVPELAKALPADLEIIDRSTVNAWNDARVRAAVEATGRKKIIIAGISIEVCVALPSISATAAGYDVHAAIDASGTFSDTKRTTGLLRMHQAGVILTDYATAAVEMLADNASPLAAELYATIDMPFATIVGQLASAYAKKS